MSGLRQRGAAAAGAAAVVLAALTFGTGAARAEWGAPQVLSASTTQQAEVGIAPAVSQDGRFVAFEGTYAGRRGIWRRQIDGGALELVTSGEQARAPSISADGRWIAFTTRTALDPLTDTNTVGDVYVRDMDAPSDASAAYTLASAVDGAATGLAYAAGLGDGSSNASAVALSADGRSVAFTTMSPSNLAAGGAQTTTPAGQIAVRRLDAQSTLLVSTLRDPAMGEQTAAPVPRGAAVENLSSAALSADGTTVAWYGTNLADQVATVAGERAADSTGGSAYGEPLWRRIADGPAAPTRRVTGGGDPTAQGCPPDGHVTSTGGGPCDGPFVSDDPDFRGTLTTQTGGTSTTRDTTPHLSADGRFVALLVAAPPAGSIAGGDSTANAFLVDMHPGLTRRQALTPLTAWASANFGNLLLAANVQSIAISPSGRRVAFTTSRGVFPLSPPLLIDSQLSQLSATELYDVDLERGLMRRVTRGFDGGPSLPTEPGRFLFGAADPSYTADGRRLVFSSEAPNLFYGDGNEASDVFEATWSDPSVGPGPPQQRVAPAPSASALTPTWRLGVTAVSRADGRVAVNVVTPAAGRLAISASASMRTTTRARVRVKRRGRTRFVRRSVTRLRTRTVATRAQTVGAPGLTQLRLTLPRQYAARARSRRGLRATVTVTFRAGRRQLRSVVPASFRVRATRKTAKR